MAEAIIPQDPEIGGAVRPEEVHELGIDALKGAGFGDEDASLWFGEEKTPEQEVFDRKQDLIAQFYGMGLEIPDGEDWDGITAADMREWYAGLGEEEREYADVMREDYVRRDQEGGKVRTELEKSAPELLRGRLPSDLEQLVGSDYQLGINQWGTSTVQESQELLRQHNGIDMGMYGVNIDQKFVIIDGATPEDYTEHAVTQGYYGNPNLGRFVVAMPGKNYIHDLPEDFFVSNGNTDGDMYKGDTSVSAKYMAGFIDEHGTFSRNAGFMKSTTPQLVSSEQADWL